MQAQVLDYVHKSLTRYSDARENQRISASNKLILLLLWARVRRKRVVVMAYGHNVQYNNRVSVYSALLVY